MYLIFLLLNAEYKPIHALAFFGGHGKSSSGCFSLGWFLCPVDLLNMLGKGFAQGRFGIPG
jgi:hypothetical protein